MPSHLPRASLIDASRATVLALTLVAFLLRVWLLDGQSLWRDEVDVIRLAHWPPADLLRSLGLAEHNGPLYYIVMRGWLGLAGDSEFALRFVSLCGGVLGVPLIWRVAGRLVGRRAALMAVLVSTVSSYLVWYAQDAKMYATVVALTLLAMWCWWRALDTGRVQWWAGFVAVSSVSFYIHMLSALMIPVYALALPILGRHGGGRHTSRLGHGPAKAGHAWQIALGLLVLPYLPLAAWQLPLVLQTHQTGHAFVPLPDMFALLVNLTARGMTMVDAWPVTVPFLFALLLGAFGPATRVGGSDWRPRLVLLLWALLPVVLLYLISLRVPLFEPRYLIFTVPAFYVLAARGMAGVTRLCRPVAAALLAALIVFGLLGIAVQDTRPIKSDFRAAAAFVAARYGPGEPIMFQVPYVRHTFDYYFPHEYPGLDGPWTNDGKNEESAAQLMAATVGDHTQLWLVSSESWLWDGRGLTGEWLDSHAHLLESASFTRVDVYYYRIDLPAGSTRPTDTLRD